MKIKIKSSENYVKANLKLNSGPDGREKHTSAPYGQDCNEQFSLFLCRKEALLYLCRHWTEEKYSCSACKETNRCW